MQHLATLILGLGVGAAGASALIQPSTHAHPQEQRKQEARSGDQELPAGMDMEMMMKMMKLAAPGEQHAELMKGVGDWVTANSMRMAPDAPWTDFEGSMKAKSVLGGRWLLEEIDMTVMGMPMQGLQLIGYDNLAEEYVAIWMDSMSTWPITSRGKAQEDGSINFEGTMIDVAGARPFRMVTQQAADGSVHTTMYDTIPPVGEIEVMKIVATRKQAAAR